MAINVSYKEDGLIELERDGYGFRFFFNAGYDKQTGMCDAEGVEVFDIDDNGDCHPIGIVYNKTIEDVKEMNDNEFNQMLDEAGIF